MNDTTRQGLDNLNMADGLAQDWYLREWMSRKGKIQADLVKELGWDKARANFVYHSKQSYRRDLVNELSRWLEVEPYELLMPPQEADALRRLRESAEEIANSARAERA